MYIIGSLRENDVQRGEGCLVPCGAPGGPAHHVISDYGMQYYIVLCYVMLRYVM